MGMVPSTQEDPTVKGGVSVIHLGRCLEKDQLGEQKKEPRSTTPTCFPASGPQASNQPTLHSFQSHVPKTLTYFRSDSLTPHLKPLMISPGFRAKAELLTEVSNALPNSALMLFLLTPTWSSHPVHLLGFCTFS